jgi:hypothetical protein
VKQTPRSKLYDFHCLLCVFIAECEFLVNVFCRYFLAVLTKSFYSFQWEWGKQVVRKNIFCFVFNVLFDLVLK